MIKDRGLFLSMGIIGLALIPMLYIVRYLHWRISFAEIESSSNALIFVAIFCVTAMASFALGYWFIRNLQLQPYNENLQLSNSFRSAAKKIVRQRIQELAREYELARVALPSSPERTERMEAIVRKMRSLFISNPYPIDELMFSDSPGERLAAVVSLQIKPKEEKKYLEWIAERLYDEKPFIGVQASLALLSAARVLDYLQRSDIRAAINEAKYRLQQKDLKESEQWQILEVAENTLNEKT